MTYTIKIANRLKNLFHRYTHTLFLLLFVGSANAQEAKDRECERLVKEEKYYQAMQCYGQASNRDPANTVYKVQMAQLAKKAADRFAHKVKKADSLAKAGFNNEAYTAYFHCLELVPESPYPLDRIKTLSGKLTNDYNESQRAAFLLRNSAIKDSLYNLEFYTAARTFYTIFLDHSVSFSKTTTEQRLKKFDRQVDSLRFLKLYPVYSEDGSFITKRVYFKNKCFKYSQRSKTGQLLYEGYMVEGLHDSIAIQYYPDKPVARQVQYFSKGKLQGTSTRYFADGKIESTASYKNGLCTGKYTWLYPNGALKSLEEYSNDTLNGPRIEFYNTGIPLSEGHYVKGKLEGNYKTYFPDGSVQVSCVYRNNLREGEELEYYANGKVKHKIKYHLGKELSRKDYRPDGSEYNYYERMY